MLLEYIEVKIIPYITFIVFYFIYSIILIL